MNQNDHPTESSPTSYYQTQARHVRQCVWEAKVIVAIWLAGLIWICWGLVGWGYIAPESRPAEPDLFWGMPSWVFWGLFVPWFGLILATWWFALAVLKDDEPYMPMPPRDDAPASETPPTTSD